MSRHLFLSLALGLSLILVNTRCSRGPTGETGPSLSGTLTGFATLVNADGSQPQNRDSVLVKIEGINDSIMTDPSGKWTFADVNTGTYTISFTKQGFGTSKSVQYQFIGGTEPKDLGITYLCKSPAFSVESLIILGATNVRNDTTSVYLKAKLSDLSVNGPGRLYLVLSPAPDSNISVAPTLYEYSTFFTVDFGNGLDSTNVKLTPTTFAAAGFLPGETLYVGAYTANAGSNSSGYLDTLTGKTQYTNLDTARSNVLRVVVPSFSPGTLTSTLSGFVTLVNADGSQPADRDSVRVTLEGTGDTVLTDTTGMWTIARVRAGSYTISYSKPGYGISKTFNSQVTSGNNKDLGNTNLCQPPSFSVDSLSPLGYSASRPDSTSLYLRALLDTSITGPYRVYFVFSRDSSDVAPTPSLNESSLFSNAYFKKGIDSVDLRLTPANIASVGFQSGDTIYAAAYAANGGGINSGYLDTLTDKTVYTNVNARGSNVIRVVIP